MAKHPNRRPVFQDATASETRVEIEPPFQPAQEEVDDVIGMDEPSEETFEELIEETSVEESAPIHASEPEAPSVEDSLPNGWKLISEVQHTGEHFLVTNDFNSEGQEAFWRKTRVLSHNKWVSHGKWSVALTRLDVLPEPRFYKKVH